MAAWIKAEVLSENCPDKKCKEENVEKQLESDGEITIMKTEVTEELYNCEMIGNDVELINTQEISAAKYLQPKSAIKLLPDNKLATKGVDVKNCKEEKFQANKYICDTCSSGFKKDYFDHYRNCVSKQKTSKELNVEEAVSICYLCKTEISEEKLYGYHMKRCVKKNLQLKNKNNANMEYGRIFKCDKCDYSTERKFGLKSHLCIHLKEKSFKCSSCEYVTTIKSNLKKHTLVKHSNEEKRYKCEYCEYSTHRKEHLDTHIRMHNNERPFKCNICEFTTVYKKNLKNHILIKHRGEVKKYACKNCEYSTPAKSALTMHMRIHTDDKPFKCNICKYASFYKGNLMNHLLVRHSLEIKKYKCQNCDYSTHLKSNLIVHMHVHSNEKPFKCHICIYATAYKRVLRQHMLTHHSKKIN